MKKYILIALFSLSSGTSFGRGRGLGVGSMSIGTGQRASISSDKCSKDKPCFNLMDDVPKKINSLDDFKKGKNTARQCIGKKRNYRDRKLKKQYNKLKEKTWIEVIRIEEDGAIKKCLEKLVPCFDQMKNINPEVKDAKNYAEIIKKSFNLIRWPVNISDEALESEYTNLKDPKKTWAEIASQRDPNDRVRACLESIPKK